MNLKSEDLVQKSATERFYDSFNRLIKEKQATGFEICYAYDALDRIMNVQFQDQKITYTYSATSLVSAARYKNDRLLYTFMQETDWRGDIIQQTLPGNLTLNCTWDPLGKCSSIDSTQFQQFFNYDKVGNLLSTEIQDPLGNYESNFSYDDLNQIKQESGVFNHHYLFDSLNNRKSLNGSTCSSSPLNQTTSDLYGNYTYDKNGNRVAKDDTKYTYDALNRLTSTFVNGTRITYKYDSFGRRMERASENETLHYLYQFDTEIGSLINGEIKEFRAIYEPFSPFAIELNETVYVPIRNHRGDTCVLLDLEGTSLSTYRYDAFGQFLYQGSIQSPWAFCGQRYDEATKLHHFLNRDYDSLTGKWLTPDPLGFADGPNLYAYVHNNPWTHIDLYGLLEKSLYESAKEKASEVWHSPEFRSGVQGACQMFGGTCEMISGGFIAYGSSGLAAPAGFAAIAHGADHFAAGFNSFYTGSYQETLTSHTLQKTGMSENIANFTDNTASMFATIVGSTVKIATQQISGFFKVPPKTVTRCTNLSRGGENINAGISLNTKLSQLENFTKNAAKTKVLPDGRIRYHGIETMSRTVGPTRSACNVLEWNPKTYQSRWWYECYDHLGRVNRVHPKYINGQTVSSQHYPPIGSEL